MKLTVEFFFLSFLSHTTIVMTFPCEAACPTGPPPTGLAYEWLDEFTLNLTWEKPTGLLDDSDIGFLLKIAEDKEGNKHACVSGRNLTESFLTEEMGSGSWTYNIWTVSKQCNRSNGGPHADITIKPSKPRAELVRDFRCLTYSKKMKCSWIPTNPSLNLTISYRTCGRFKEQIESLKTCSERYSSDGRDGCNLHIDTTPDNICILVDTEAGMSTFKPVLMVPPPKMNISEVGDNLRLSCTPPEIGNSRCWNYEVCYKQCSEPSRCRNTTSGEPAITLDYKKSCLYEFRSRVWSPNHCLNIFSNFSEDATYGSNVSPDRTLTVVAIVIPIILSLCVILSCYCFRRHSAIICPILPDPSAIFKEMIMNGNKELKTTPESLYTPVPEPIEPCKITIVTEHTDL